MCRLFWNRGASNSWNPKGLSRRVIGLLCSKTVVKKLHSFRIVFMYQTTHLISILAALKIPCDGRLFFLAAFITYYIHILYIWYYSLEKKEIRRTSDAGKRIFMMEISARRPEPLHKTVLQRYISWTALPAWLSFAGTSVGSKQLLQTSPARNYLRKKFKCFVRRNAAFQQ